MLQECAKLYQQAVITITKGQASAPEIAKGIDALWQIAWRWIPRCLSSSEFLLRFPDATYMREMAQQEIHRASTFSFSVKQWVVHHCAARYNYNTPAWIILIGAHSTALICPICQLQSLGSPSFSGCIREPGCRRIWGLHCKSNVRVSELYLRALTSLLVALFSRLKW